MRITVILQLVEHGLMTLCHIPHTEGVTLDGYVEGQFMAHRGHIPWISKNNIMVVMSQIESLVITLPIVRGEGNAHQRK